MTEGFLFLRTKVQRKTNVFVADNCFCFHVELRTCPLVERPTCSSRDDGKGEGGVLVLYTSTGPCQEEIWCSQWDFQTNTTHVACLSVKNWIVPHFLLAVLSHYVARFFIAIPPQHGQKLGLKLIFSCRILNGFFPCESYGQ